MTRNSEIDCEDLFECDHSPETPIVSDGEIEHWLCRCGRVVELPPPRKPVVTPNRKP